jgi:hypothetical protein
MTSATPAWSAWNDLNPPTGGWTWAKIQALEVKVWETVSSANAIVHKIEVGVITEEATPDIGAVEFVPGGADETATLYSGTHGIKFAQGTDHYEILRSVAAGTSLSVSVRARHTSAYVGTKPRVRVTMEDGTEYSDVQSGAANAWEELALTTGVSATDGVARVRLECSDESQAGECIFSALVFAVV